MADPDLHIKWGPGHQDSEKRKRGGGAVSNFFFRPFGPTFGLKIRGSATGIPYPNESIENKYLNLKFSIRS